MTDLLTAIAGITGPAGLIAGADVAERPADWLGLTKCAARAIVRPASTEELARVMGLCQDNGQSVVAAGGLTGMVHGTDAGPADVLVSFERMTAIEAIDPIGRTITVQTGVQLQKVQEAARAAGMLFGVDLGARGSATVGGVIATNAGGNQVIRYGMMRQQVLGLEAVLADGTVISSMNTLLKNNTGYDLKQLFIGAEGTLGLVTRAVLRLWPLPKSEATALVAIPDFDALVAFFRHVGAELGSTLTAFEVMWPEHYRLIAIESGRHTPPLADGAGYYVIVEMNGNDPETDQRHFERVLGAALEGGLASDAAIAGSKAQRDAIWGIREDIAGLVVATMPAVGFDVSLPIRCMEAYIADLRQAVRAAWGEEGRLIVFGHLGDGNLHLVIAPRPWSEEAKTLAEEMAYAPLAAIGGSVSAEHGIGIDKRAYLPLCRAPEEIALMRTLKAALDPKGILNPGKIFA